MDAFAKQKPTQKTPFLNALKIRLAKLSLQRNVNLLVAFNIRINLGKRKITRFL